MLEREWPSTAPELRQAMEDDLAASGDERPLDVQLFDLASDILRTATQPELRSAVLEVVAGLPIEIVGHHDDGSVTFAVTYDQPPMSRLALTIAADGRLVAESQTWMEPYPLYGAPAGTEFANVTYQPVRVVDDVHDS